MIQIEFLHNGAIVRVMQFQEKAKARAVYVPSSEAAGQYTRLIVDRETYTTAQARRYFGMPKIGGGHYDF